MMPIKTSPPKALPILAIPLGLIIAGFALYGFLSDLWHLYSSETVIKAYTTGGGKGVLIPHFAEIGGIAAWLQLLGQAGLVATGLSAIVPWFRERFFFIFPLTLLALVLSNLISGYGN